MCVYVPVLGNINNILGIPNVVWDPKNVRSFVVNWFVVKA